MTTDYLWKSLRSVIFLIGFHKNDSPEAHLKYSIFNRKYSIIYMGHTQPQLIEPSAGFDGITGVAQCFVIDIIGFTD